MKVIIRNYGTLVSEQQKSMDIAVGNSVSFDYLDEKIIVTVTDFNSDFYTVSLNREFSLLNFGVVNLTDARRDFDIPNAGKTTLALPAYDEICNLEFSVVEEGI